MADPNPHQLRLERDALADAFAQHLNGILTEPLPLGKLADYFDVNPKTMKAILRSTKGAKRHGRLWRVPLRTMTPKYFLEIGFIPQE